MDEERPVHERYTQARIDELHKVRDFVNSGKHVKRKFDSRMLSELEVIGAIVYYSGALHRDDGYAGATYPAGAPKLAAGYARAIGSDWTMSWARGELPEWADEVMGQYFPGEDGRRNAWVSSYARGMERLDEGQGEG